MTGVQTCALPIWLAVSSAYWPIAWPAPGRVTISVYPGASRLLLPVRPASEIDDRLARFGPPECARIPEATQLRPAQLKRTYERDLTSSDTVYSVYSDGGDFEGAAISRVHDIDLDIGHTVRRRYCIGESDPLTARECPLGDPELQRAKRLTVVRDLHAVPQVGPIAAVALHRVGIRHAWKVFGRVLPRGTPQQVRDHVRRNVDTFAPGGGFVFDQVHNILAEVPPENVVAMYEAVGE